jgi:chitodextrinase
VWIVWIVFKYVRRISMNLTLKRAVAWVMLAGLSIVLAACSSSGENASSGGVTTISGVAVKGPIKGALVEIYQLKQNGGKGDLLGSGITLDGGIYQVDIPAARASEPLVVVVKGQAGATYKSESQNNIDVPFGASNVLTAVIEKAVPAQDVVVSPLTEVAYQKLQAVLTENPALTAEPRVINSVNTVVATTFHVADIQENPFNNNDYKAALTIIDQMVVNSNAGGSDPGNTTTVMNTISQAVNVVGTTDGTQQQVYQTYVETLATAVATYTAAPTADPTLVTSIQNLQEQVTTNNTQPAPDLTNVIPPTAPFGLTATASALTSTTSSVALVWGTSAPAVGSKNLVSGYDVYRDGIKIVTVNSKTLGYTDGSVTPNSTYLYSVIAFDTAGNRSAASNTISVTPLAANLGITVNGQLSSGILALPEINDFTAPAAPANLAGTTTAVTGTSSKVNLAWSPATDNKAVTGYDIYRNNVKITTVATPGYTDTVIPAVTYSYYVVAFDAAGNRSAASAPLAITPNQANLAITVSGQLSSDATGGAVVNDLLAPSVPAALAASAAAVNSTTSTVTLSWNPATDNKAVTGYDVFRNGTKVATVASPGYTDTVAPAVAYSYYVVAFDAASNRSATSSQVSITPPQVNLGITVNGQLSGSAVGP